MADIDKLEKQAKEWIEFARTECFQIQRTDSGTEQLYHLAQAVYGGLAALYNQNGIIIKQNENLINLLESIRSNSTSVKE
jgi:hypothetical protein